MRTNRPYLQGMIESLVDVGHVVSTTIADAASSVILRVSGIGPAEDQEADDGDDVAEELDAESWGEANVLSRPLDPNGDGECEVLFVRNGDKLEIVGFRDRRYQVTLEKGEVLVRNLHADASKRAFIKLTKDGECFIDAVKVYVGTAGATEKIALGTALKNFLTDLKTWMDSHIHSAITTATVGTGSVGTVTVAAPTSSSPTIPTIESRHVVEGA